MTDEKLDIEAVRKIRDTIDLLAHLHPNTFIRLLNVLDEKSIYTNRLQHQILTKEVLSLLGNTKDQLIFNTVDVLVGLQHIYDELYTEYMTYSNILDDYDTYSEIFDREIIVCTRSMILAQMNTVSKSILKERESLIVKFKNYIKTPVNKNFIKSSNDKIMKNVPEYYTWMYTLGKIDDTGRIISLV